MKNYGFVCLIIMSVIGCLGCNGGRCPLSGTVTFEDGTPLTCGIVQFDNGKQSATAPIGLDGSWKAGMAQQGNGIIPGTYTVYISGAIAMTNNTGSQGMNENITPLIDNKYCTSSTSGWSYTIDKSTKTLDLKVTRPAKK